MGGGIRKPTVGFKDSRSETLSNIPLSSVESGREGEKERMREREKERRREGEKGE